MSAHNRAVVKPAMSWEQLAEGADISAAVVMAIGFALPAGQEVRERYRIARSLGEGGMGQVLEVTLVGAPDAQLYALKMVARPSDPTKARAQDPADRLEAERQAAAFASLLRGEAAKQEIVQRHGVSVARLFALVRFDDQSLGLRMEIARGRSIESIIEADAHAGGSKTADIEFALVVVRKLLYQLRRLHELVDPSSPSGFVHSDVKPGNVFVDDGDRYDPQITLLDFGVATAGHALGVDLAASGAGRKSLVLNDAGGTLGYAPPHHFTGKPTPLSDTFAALVILYEMIALASPWDLGGQARSAMNLFKLEDAIRRGPRPIASVRPEIAPASAEVLDEFFGIEFASMCALAEEAQLVRGSNIEADRVAMRQRLRGLAAEYQDRLDALRSRLLGSASRTGELQAARAEVAPVAPKRNEDRPTALMRAKTELATPSTSAAAKAVDEVSADDLVPELPMRRSRGAWWLFVFIILAAGAAAYGAVQGVPPEVTALYRSVRERLFGSPPQTTRSARAGAQERHDTAPPPGAGALAVDAGALGAANDDVASTDASTALATDTTLTDGAPANALLSADANGLTAMSVPTTDGSVSTDANGETVARTRDADSPATNSSVGDSNEPLSARDAGGVVSARPSVTVPPLRAPQQRPSSVRAAPPTVRHSAATQRRQGARPTTHAHRPARSPSTRQTAHHRTGRSSTRHAPTHTSRRGHR